MKANPKITSALSLLILFAISTSDAFAQDPPRRRPGRRPDGQRRRRVTPPAEEKKKPEKKPEKKDLSVTAITGGDIMTVTNGTVRRGTILVQDGKITAIGQDIEIPKGAKVIDAKGHVVTPGFISITTAGVGVQVSSSSTRKPEDSLNPFDPNVRMALGVGITTSYVTTGGGRGGFGRSPAATKEKFLGLDEEIDEAKLIGYDPNLGDPDTAVCKCCGLPILTTAPLTRPKPSPMSEQAHAVVKMSVGSIDGMFVTKNAFFHVNSGSLTGRLAKHKWRQTVAAAKLYIKELAEYEKKKAAGDKKAKAPKKAVSDGILKLVKKEISMRVPASTASGMRNMIALAKELDYRLVIDSAVEAWVVADELVDADVSVIFTPRTLRNPELGKEDTTGSYIAASGVLEKAGVPFAITPMGSSISLMGLAGRDLTSLPLEAAFVIRGEASEQTALESITITPARMMGLDDRVGSLEVGKDADILILNGNPLDYRTYVQHAMVNGRMAYNRKKDKVFPVYDRD